MNATKKYLVDALAKYYKKHPEQFEKDMKLLKRKSIRKII